MCEANDKFLTDLAKMIEREDDKVCVLNVGERTKLSAVYEMAKNEFVDKDVSIGMTEHKPIKCVGCVHIVGKSVIFDNPKLLCEMARHSNGLSIIPLTSGSVSVEFGFNRLTDSIG